MMNEHTVKSFDEELQELDQHGRRDGRPRREASSRDAVEALAQRDAELRRAA